MKVPLSAVAQIISFFSIKKRYQITVINKKLQGLLEIASQNYKLLSEIKANGNISSNYSLYYDYYLKEYPKVKPEIVKECVLEYINSVITPTKAIIIDNINDFSADILDSVSLKNVNLVIYSFINHNKRINKNNTSSCKYITLNIINKDEKIRGFDINYFFDEIISPSLPYIVMKRYNKDIKLLLYEKISHLVNIKAVSDYDNQLFWNEMAKNFGLTQFKKLEYFYLTYNRSLKEKFIKCLKEQSDLKYIEVTYKTGSFREFLELVENNKKTLETVRINDFHLEPETSFVDFPNLQEVDFDYSSILQDPIKPENLLLPKLERFYVPKRKFPIETLKKLIEQSKVLEEVRIKLDENYDIENFNKLHTLIEPISKLTKLTDIYIAIPKRILNQGSCMVQYLSFISSIKSETVTLVSTNDSIIDINSILNNFPKITAIEGLPMIKKINKKKLSQLKTLKLYLDESISIKEIKFIKFCKNLHKIKLTGLVKEEMFRKIIAFISNLINLRSIKLDTLQIKNQARLENSYYSLFLLNLNKFKYLKRLNLPRMYCTTHFIGQLKLPLLQSIKMEISDSYIFPTWVHQNFLNIKGHDRGEQHLYFNHKLIEIEDSDDEDMGDARSYVSSSSGFSV